MRILKSLLFALVAILGVVACEKETPTPETPAPETPEISIELVAVDSESVTVNVIPASTEYRWIPMIAYKEYFDTFEDSAELAELDRFYFESLANSYEMTLADFIVASSGQGRRDNIVIGDLDPETEYVVYTYGITTEGERVTDVCTLEFTTTSAE